MVDGDRGHLQLVRITSQSSLYEAIRTLPLDPATAYISFHPSAEKERALLPHYTKLVYASGRFVPGKGYPSQPKKISKAQEIAILTETLEGGAYDLSFHIHEPFGKEGLNAFRESYLEQLQKVGYELQLFLATFIPLQQGEPQRRRDLLRLCFGSSYLEMYSEPQELACKWLDGLAGCSPIHL